MPEEFKFPSKKPELFTSPRKDIPLIGLLGGEQGKEIDAEIQKKYGEFKIFPKTFIENWTNNQVEMSPNIEGYEDDDGFGTAYIHARDNAIGKLAKCFYTVAVQEYLPEGTHVATLGELEKSIQMNDILGIATPNDWSNRGLIRRSLDLVTGFVLRGPGGEHHPYLSQNLMSQIRELLPVMISLKDLELAKDANSPYKISFKLKEDAEIIPRDFFKQIDLESSLESSDRVNVDAHYLDIDPDTGLPMEFIRKTPYEYNKEQEIFRGKKLIKKEEYQKLFDANLIRGYYFPGNSPKIQSLSPVSVQGGMVSLEPDALSSGGRFNWRVAIVSPGKEE